VLFWAFATWLVPVLVAAGWWRHVVHRIPLGYDATLWSIVFPLGMYAVAGISLGQADGLPSVRTIGSAELWIALAAFALTFTAMVVHVFRTVALPAQEPAEPGRG
jgi:tellurite resistance protein TehA-like permease